MSAYREIDEQELIPFHQEVYQSADKLTQYFILGYFGAGICLAFFNQSWILALIMGGLLVGTYYLIRHFLQQTNFFRICISLIFWLFPLQFIFQMHGDLSMAFFYFVSLTVLLFYEDKWVLLPVIFSAIISYFILYTGTVDGLFLGLPMEELPVDVVHMLLHIGIMALYAVLAVVWANIQRSQTRESGITFIKMDEQLKMMDVNIKFADHISQGNLQAPYPTDNADRLGDSLLNMRKSLKEAAIREKKEAG